MSAFNRVLVGLDFDETAASAILSRACQLTDPQHIEAVHACDTFHHVNQDYPVGAFKTSEALDQAVRDEADEFLARVCKPLGVTTRRILGGRAAKAIHNRARRDVDLIVVGSHGRKGMSGLLASTSNSVLRGTSCSVLAVHLPTERNPDTDVPRYQRVLAAIDLSPDCDRVLAQARALADACDARLLLCHADPRLGSATETSRRRLADIATIYGVHDSYVHAVRGGTAKSIHTVARDVAADVIVVGTHGRKGLEALRGSTANAVLHGVPCDELAVRLD